MFFQRKNPITIKNKNSSLSSMKRSTSSKYDSHSFGERISLFTLLKLPLPATIMVESAIVIPVFMMACVSLLFLVEVFRLENTIQGGIFLTGQSISESLYLIQIDGENSISVNFPAGMKGISILAIKEMVLDKVTPERLDKSCIKGGSDGLSFFYSNVTGDWVDVVVNYKIKLPFSMIPLPEIPIVQRCRIRGWTGSDGMDKKQDTGETMVYMTSNGTVYHLNKNCSYIKLSIRKVLFLTVKSLRNSNGAKYYPCESCIKKGNAFMEVYIAEDGTRYHSTLCCSKLKRNIVVVPLSETNGIPCCSRCGK